MLRNPLYQYGKDTIKVPAHLNFAKEVLDKMVENKDVIALINAETDERITYGEFAQMTADVALSLVRIGVRKGDIVSICSENNIQFLPTMLGVICAGAAFAPLFINYENFLTVGLSLSNLTVVMFTILRAVVVVTAIIPEIVVFYQFVLLLFSLSYIIIRVFVIFTALLLHFMTMIHPKVIFCSRTAYDTHRTILDKVGSVEHYILYGDEKREGAMLFKEFLTESTSLDNFLPVLVDSMKDPVVIASSSGTTGLHKVNTVTHMGLYLREVFTDPTKRIRILNTKDMSFSFGFKYSLTCLKACHTLIFTTTDSTKKMLEAVQKYKVKAILLTPYNVREMIKSYNVEDYDLSTLEYIISGTTYLRKETITSLKQRLPNLVSVVQVYAMIEAGVICREQVAGKGSRAGSCGTPRDGLVIKVVNIETRQPLGSHQRGEICVKGLSVMEGYLGNESLDWKDEEGFLKTGDFGYYDEDGYFYIINRIVELIKYRDVLVPPSELEEVLLQHPAVREAGVVGLPHPDFGEVPTAFVVLQPGSTVTEVELVKHLNNRNQDAVVRVVDHVPLTVGKKLDRHELKRWQRKSI